MSVELVAGIEATGAVVLAVWLAWRFPEARPRTLGSTASVFAGALILQVALHPVSTATADVTGPGGVLLVVLVPYVTLVSWSALRVLQALYALVGAGRR